MTSNKSHDQSNLDQNRDFGSDINPATGKKWQEGDEGYSDYVNSHSRDQSGGTGSGSGSSGGSSSGSGSTGSMNR